MRGTRNELLAPPTLITIIALDSHGVPVFTSTTQAIFYSSSRFFYFSTVQFFFFFSSQVFNGHLHQLVALSHFTVSESKLYVITPERFVCNRHSRSYWHKAEIYSVGVSQRQPLITLMLLNYICHKTFLTYCQVCYP